MPRICFVAFAFLISLCQFNVGRSYQRRRIIAEIIRRNGRSKTQTHRDAFDKEHKFKTKQWEVLAAKK